MTQKEEWKLFGVGLVIIIIVLAVLLTFFLVKPYSFELVEKSVVFYSNDFPPEFGLEQLAGQENFLLAVEFLEEGPLNQYMNGSLNLFSVVLVGNEKKVTNLYRVVSSETRELVYCRTNFGDPLQDEELTVEACTQFLEEFEGITIQIFLPNSAQSKAHVLVSAGTIEVHASSVDDLGIAGFSTLTKMYANANDIITVVNQIAGGLS
ncbi:hypothetical protein KKE06_02895 [Candidatus Micrarchaeota archaeon]|nr:hypothetical protein [Candidatus Micrarchaeota archaeon]MBU1930403.1 hypothetical protein [Candidatus Micrarchaeota archaeon]